MEEKSPGRRIWAGALFISGATIIGKVLSSLYRVPYQNMTGDLGYYVYQQVYPLYGAAMVIAMYGFPVIISKMIVDAKLDKGIQEAKETAWSTFFILSLLFTILFVLFYTGAGTIALFMGDVELTGAIRTMSYVLLTVPILSVVRGYFQGMNQMEPTAYSHVAEKFIRVAGILLFAWLAVTLGNGAYDAGEGASAGSVFGSVVSVLVLVWFLQKNRKKSLAQPLSYRNAVHRMPGHSKVLLTQGLVVCLGALLFILYQMIDAFTVVRFLQMNGAVGEEAMIAKGIFDRGQPLLQFGTVIASSFAMVLVPLLQEERMKGKLASSRYYASLMMKVSFLLGMAAAAGMVILTEPINIMLFTNDSGTGVLRTLSTALVMSGTVMISAAVLQGNGSFRVPAVSLAAGFAVKLICNIVLIPVLDTHGAAIGTVAGLSVTAAVNIYWIYRKDMMEAFTIVWLGKALAALAGMSILLLVMMTAGEDLMHDENRLVAAGFTLMTCAAGGILFLYLTAVLQVITKEEQNMLPGVKKLQSLRKRRNK